MKNTSRALLFLCLCLTYAGAAAAQSLSPDLPTWWTKYQTLLKSGAAVAASLDPAVTVGPNVDQSSECGPQSETFITLDHSNTAVLTAGSNEIFRLPMRGYFSSDGGSSWGAVDVPLPPPLSGTHDNRFASDPTLAFDTKGHVFYGYIAVFFSAGGAINGTALDVARSSDGGKTYPLLTQFSFSPGENHFNDKPMITADTNPASPFRDNVYIAWDAASGGSGAGGIRLGGSTDHGQTFTVTRVDNAKGPGRGIGAVPFVGPNGEVYVAWNDFARNTIAFNRSLDAGVTFGQQTIVAAKTVPFQIPVPAESFRGALIYPACDADRSSGPHRGRLYCSWMDQTPAGFADIFLSFSDDRGATWSAPKPVPDQLASVDRFNHWLSVDAATGDVSLSFYDTRNDATGFRFETDVYFTRSSDGGATFLSPNVRVTTAKSNEHDCNGVFPCPGIDLGNQYGDYEGLVSFGGVSHPTWTDSRDQLQPSTGCRTDLLMEEIFTATVQ